MHNIFRAQITTRRTHTILPRYISYTNFPLPPGQFLSFMPTSSNHTRGGGRGGLCPHATSNPFHAVPCNDTCLCRSCPTRSRHNQQKQLAGSLQAAAGGAALANSPEASSWKPEQHPGTAMKSSNSYLTYTNNREIGVGGWGACLDNFSFLFTFMVLIPYDDEKTLQDK